MKLSCRLLVGYLTATCPLLVGYLSATSPLLVGYLSAKNNGKTLGQSLLFKYMSSKGNNKDYRKARDGFHARSALVQNVSGTEQTKAVMCKKKTKMKVVFGGLQKLLYLCT